MDFYYIGRVYLAGPIRDSTYDKATDWRNYAVSRLKESNILGISPMRFKEFLKDCNDLSNPTEHPLTLVKGVVSRDEYDIKKCDLMLCNLLGAEKISIGTMIEYGLARANGKPIITIIEKSGNVHEHKWIRELSGFCVEKLDDGLSIAKAIICT